MIPSNQSKKLWANLCVIGTHIMGIYLHHVLATIYVFVAMACSVHLVKSDHFEKQRIRECYGKNEDCSAERQTGGKDNVLLRLPRIEGIKVNPFTRKYRKTDLETMSCLAYTDVGNTSKWHGASSNGSLFCYSLL